MRCVDAGDTVRAAMRLRPVLAVGSTITVAACALALAPAASASGTAPKVTRAALDPALVQGRGARVPFLEQEAENAVTNGVVIGPSRDAYTLPAEASGRSAVRLDAPGDDDDSADFSIN